MKLISPITVSDSILTSTTIPEPDAAQGEVAWVAGAYVVGDEVIKSTTHRRYRCAVGTSDDPENGVLKSPKTWVDIGATNQYAMFDDKNGSKTTRANNITVELLPQQSYTAIAGIYIEGASAIQVTMTDPTAGVVYDVSIDMLDSSGIIDYFEWFNYPVFIITEFILLDLPSYPTATLKVELTGIGDVSIGSMPFGIKSELGIANYGTSFNLVDLSKKEKDEYGNYTIRERPVTDVVDFDVTIPRSKVRYSRNLVAKYRNTPVVWVGGDGGEEAPIFTFGYYKSFRVNIDAPSECSATLVIEELI